MNITTTITMHTCSQPPAVLWQRTVHAQEQRAHVHCRGTAPAVSTGASVLLSFETLLPPVRWIFRGHLPDAAPRALQRASGSSCVPSASCASGASSTSFAVVATPRAVQRRWTIIIVPCATGKTSERRPPQMSEFRSTTASNNRTSKHQAQKNDLAHRTPPTLEFTAFMSWARGPSSCSKCDRSISRQDVDSFLGVYNT